MNFQAADIETIVRVVLQRLRSMNAVPERPITAETLAAKTNATPPASTSSTLVLNDRLISLESLRGQLSDVTTLKVNKQAVVTPAVLDELRDKGIGLERYSPAAKPSLSSSGTSLDSSLLLMVDGSAKPWQSFPGQVLASNLNAAADARRIVAHLIGGGSHAIWCTNRPFAASLAAAAKPELQSIQLPSPTDLPQAVEEATPNLLVIDQSSWNASQLSDIAQQWRQLT